MYLIFDTETTGLPRNYSAPAEDLENWPRLVQLAWQCYSEQGELLEEKNFIIKPDGFEIPEKASAVHGISTQRALEEGVPLELAMNDFAKAIENSEHLVAHNIKFDEMIVASEFLRLQREAIHLQKPRLCTMHSSVNFCALEGKYGYKWPNLTELHSILFGEGFSGAHDALSDVSACAKCFFELKRRGVIS